MKTVEHAAKSLSALIRPRILLAEDHEQVRKFLHLVLKESHDVIGAFVNGRDLLAAAGSQSPDIILLDISMPEINGFEAARTLRQRMPDVPLIFVTQHKETAYLEEAIRIGVRGYVLKPLIIQELRIAIREVLQGGTFFSLGLRSPPPREDLQPDSQEGSKIGSGPVSITTLNHVRRNACSR
jgi:DNA-binding NarL/FixJ family response regulator